MSYGLKYRCEFSSYSNIQYRFDIEEKDYSGGFTTLQATGKPFLQKWATDDPKPIIKGCNATFNYLNLGTQPLRIFYSDADDNFIGKLTNLTTNETLFVGFLVQDDCSEIQIDYTHEVSLSFNDNLGLLKDVTLDAAFVDWGFVPYYEGKQSLATVLFACIYATNIKLPVRIYSNIYETTQTKQWSTFQTTLVDVTTFLKDDTTYDSCYNCLEKIFNTLECTLLQSNGSWHVIRWSELRYYPNNDINCWVWDENFAQVGVNYLNTNVDFGSGLNTYPELGLYARIQRPLKSVTEKFNYEQPNGLIKNITLKNLGALISDTLSGNIRTKTYEIPANSYWRKLNGDTSRISIDFDNTLNTEIQRYIVQPFTSYATTFRPSLTFNEIEVVKDDIIDLSFLFKGLPNSGTTKRFSMIINVQRLNGAGTDTTTNPSFATWVRTNNPDPTTNVWGWGRRLTVYNNNEPQGNAYELTLESDISQWMSFSLSNYISRTTRNGDENLEFPKIPFDGLLKIYIVGWNEPGNSTNKTGYLKDLKFNLKYRINESTNVIGQTHQTTQPPTIKNISDSTIKIDDSPRNSISGTLFIPQLTSILYTRTKQWQQENATKTGMLGEIVTFDKLFQKRLPRTILEGSFFGLIFGNVNTISALSVLISPQYSGLSFVAGNLEIDYRNDKVTGTWYELFKNGEIDTDLISTYLFTYLYENK
jgi:hypothetical protein